MLKDTYHACGNVIHCFLENLYWFGFVVDECLWQKATNQLLVSFPMPANNALYLNEMPYRLCILNLSDIKSSSYFPYHPLHTLW